MWVQNSWPKLSLKSNGALLLENTNDNNNWYIRNGGTNNATLQLGTGDSPGSNVKLTVNGDGRVGIGTAAPTVALQVAGNISASGDIIAENYIVKSTTTQITTSFSTGNTQFGDSTDDTHTFIGNITASGNIEASIFSGSSVRGGAPDSDDVTGRQTRFGGLKQECGIHLGNNGEGDSYSEQS